MPTLDSFIIFVTGTISGVALAYAYIHMVEAVARYERDHATPPPPPTPNELQRHVYAPQDTPRPVGPSTPQNPVKRGPGRPRKASTTPPTSEERAARVVGGRRATQTWIEPTHEPQAKKAGRRIH